MIDPTIIGNELLAYAPDEMTVSQAIERADLSLEVRCARYCPRRQAEDRRPATKRRMAHAANRVASTGYAGACVADEIRRQWGIAPQEHPTTPELVASVAAVLQRRR